MSIENPTQEQLLIDLYQLVQKLQSLDSEFKYSLIFDLRGGGSVESQKSDGAIGRCFNFESIEAGIWTIHGAIDAIKDRLNADANRKKFFDKVATYGGAIVSSNECTTLEIADARAGDRFFIDGDGFGFVWRTNHWLKTREEAFEQLRDRELEELREKAKS